MDKKPGTGNISVKLRTIVGEVTIAMADVIEIYFMEDITSACISGKITFNDRIGLLEQCSFTGHENITVQYGEVDFIEKLFTLHSVAKISESLQTEGSSFSQVELFFSEPQYQNLAMNTYSKSWNNETISTIVQEIYLNMGLGQPFIKFEKSNEKISFCMPYWTPIESINWLMKRASGSVTNTAGYLLYSNNKGPNFITLENLLRNGAEDIDPYSFDAQDITYLNKIIDWSITGIDGIALSKLQGGTKLGYDFNTKSLIRQLYDYKNTIKKYTMAGHNTLFPDISNTGVNIGMPGDSDPVLLRNMAHSEFIKRYMYQLQLNVTVRGHENRHVGQITNVQWPSVNKPEYIHKAMDGKYMITTIVNQFNSRMSPMWKQNMVMIKTAYTNSDFKLLHKSTIVAEKPNAAKVGITK